MLAQIRLVQHNSVAEIEDLGAYLALDPKSARSAKARALLNAIQGALQTETGGASSRILNGTSEVPHGALDRDRLGVGIHFSTLTRERRTDEHHRKGRNKQYMNQSWALHKPPSAQQISEARTDFVAAVVAQIREEVHAETQERIATQFGEASRRVEDQVKKEIEEERRADEARRRAQDEYVQEWLAKDERETPKTPKTHKFARKRWRTQ